MHNRFVLSVGVLAALSTAGLQANAAAVYLDRSAFLNDVGRTKVDTFSEYGATMGTAVQFDNATMSAVKGETRFEPTSLPGLNLVGDYGLRPGEFGYCA